MTAARLSRPIAALFVASVAAVAVASSAGVAGAQPPPDLQRIRALYEGASYDEAMRALDAAQDVSLISGEHNGMLLQYRALCLLALDRQSDAEQTVQQILAADPLQPAPDDAPPRLAKVFDRVRAAIVPAAARAQYAAAKTLFDHQQFADAASGFERVVQLDASVAHGDGDETGDLATVARGFLELSRARVAAAATDRARTVNRVFTSLDKDVVPPVPIRQEMPPWRPPVRRALAGGSADARQGRLDVVIGPAGEVQDVVITTPIEPLYDMALVRAAKTWKYQPAIRDGVAVSYRRTVIVRLVSTEGGAMNEGGASSSRGR
jgi:tetratricopeptide (TPR) repeat protein